ncbi:MAG TPA: SMP-30/gluconolactonase/LRE family protein [Pantanalinema sp.]
MKRHPGRASGLLVLILLGGVGCTAYPALPLSSDGDASSFSGVVLGLDGKPAANVAVHGYLVSNNSAGLVSNNSASYRVLAAGLEAKTDAQGRFRLSAAAGSSLNIEAVLADNVKALQLNVGTSAQSLRLMLARTGHLTGKVTAPGRSEVKNLLGAEVFIPGLPYQVHTTETGAYTLLNVPVGAFTLVGKKDGLGTATVTGVAVKSDATTQVPDLALSQSAPTIERLTPSNAGPGDVVTVTGVNFGTSTGTALRVDFNSAPATSIERIDDTTLKVVVPAGAKSGDLSITVGSVQSAAVPFTVLKALTLTPGNASVIRGGTLPFSLTGRDTSDRFIESPTASWSIAGSAVRLDGDTLYGVSLGTASLRVTAGSMRLERTLQVVERYPSVTTFSGIGTGFADGNSQQARFNSALGLTFDAAGNLYAADSSNDRIRRIAPDGSVATWAGDGTADQRDGARLQARFKSPNGVFFDRRTGSLYVSEAYDKIRKIDSSGNVTTFAGTGTPGFVDGAAQSGLLNTPWGMAMDAAGNLYVADSRNHAIRKITPSGAISTFAGSGQPGSLDGKGSNARFSRPRGIAFDADGNLYVADTENHQIRKVSPTGTVTTFAGSGRPGYVDATGAEAEFNEPYDLAFDARGRLFVADFMNRVVRVVTPQGAVSTYAGSGRRGLYNGDAPYAQFDNMSGLAIDAAGNVYVTDQVADVIRKISP